MATRFESLDLADQDLFGIRLHGAFGRGDRQRLLDLASRCLEKDKTRLILECGDLDSLGGGGAAVLADLQGQLVERGGEAVFVGAGEVIQRFLGKKFDDLPLRFFDDLDAASEALGAEDSGSRPRAAARAEEADRVEKAGEADQAGKADAADPTDSTDAADPTDGQDPARERVASPIARLADEQAGVREDLDKLLHAVEAGEAEPEAHMRRAADLVTAAYVSLDDAVHAAGPEGNAALLGEALAVLLDSHDLAAETVYFAPQGDHLVSADGSLRLPTEGGVVDALLRTRRPLTMLDLEENKLWDEESQILEDLQPDLILPLLRDEQLAGVAFLQHGGDEREYGLSEVFALELLQRVLAGPIAEDAAGPTEAAAAPATGGASETVLGAKLELARGLQDAQDVPHFWQVFISRLRPAAEVSSLVFLDAKQPDGAPFLAGEARRESEELDLSGERLGTFFRTLERPVEVANMPASFQDVRDALLDRGLHWLVGLRADDQVYLGMVALGVKWRCEPGDPAEQIHSFLDITGEALLRLRESQRRADLSLSLLESLLVNEGRGEQGPDTVTQETALAVRMLSRELGLPLDQERDLVLGALLRNCGQEQPGPDELKTGRLAGEDWERFRAHPDAGLERVTALDAPAAVRDAVRHHHERFDGRGFPLGLKARDIPLVARLVAVAQLYALHLVDSGPAHALAAVRQEAGESLDPDLVEIFVKALQRTEPVPAGV